METAQRRRAAKRDRDVALHLALRFWSAPMLRRFEIV